MSIDHPSIRNVRVTAVVAALAVIVAALPGGPPRPAYAASLVVNTVADANPPLTDGLCSLREAIANANNNAATYPDCGAGSGADGITFNVSGTITLAAPLPDVTDPAGLTIDGSGQAVAISGNKAVRPLTVTAGAALELSHLSIGKGQTNFPDTSGGGGVLNQGSLTVNASTFVENRAAFADGGAIHNRGALVVRNSEFRENVGGFFGAAIHNASDALIVSSTFTGNSALASTIFSAGTATLANVTVSANYTESNGAVENRGTMVITHSTVANNTAVNSAPGVFNGDYATLHLSNSIIAGSRQQDYGVGKPAPDCHGTLTTAGANIVQDQRFCVFVGPTPLSVDPGLAALGNYGGPTQTHGLLSGSPAIDVGDDAICAAVPVSGKDQRGAVRPAGAHCDLGSFEGTLAVTPIPNGSFEAGDSGWTLTGLVDGIARIETAGACFGANNTQGITFHGARALNVRSSPGAPVASTGIATSSSFTLGSALHFRALVENDDAMPLTNPVNFEVRILAVDGSILATSSLQPSILTTSPGTSDDGCLVGDLRDGPWSTHTIDTSAFAGQAGRAEFRQHTNVAGKGFFTLVDDVSVTAPCEKPLAPTLLSAEHRGGSHHLLWSAPTAGPTPDGYNVYGDSSDPPTTRLNTAGPVTGLTFTHSSGGHRWYGVQAVNACGVSPMGNRLNG